MSELDELRDISTTLEEIRRSQDATVEAIQEIIAILRGDE